MLSLKLHATCQSQFALEAFLPCLSRHPLLFTAVAGPMHAQDANISFPALQSPLMQE